MTILDVYPLCFRYFSEEDRSDLKFVSKILKRVPDVFIQNEKKLFQVQLILISICINCYFPMQTPSSLTGYLIMNKPNCPSLTLLCQLSGTDGLLDYE